MLLRYVLIQFLVSLFHTGYSQAYQRHKTELSNTFEFTPNSGQWHPLVRYRSEIPYGNLFLESNALHYLLINPNDYNEISQWKHDNPAKNCKTSPRLHSVRMRFLGIEFAPKLEAEYIQSHYYNYFIGNESAKWASKLHPSTQVNYKNVYPDVDLQILGQEGLKYQWVINRPTPEKIASIQVAIEGATSVKLKNGTVQIQTPCGDITDNKLFVYQQINDAIVELNAHYTLTGNVLTYKILGDFNPDYPLIIDPKLIFSTYSGSVADNFGFTATFDSKANLYAGGIAQVISTQNRFYPVTSGAYDTTYNGGGGTTPAGLLCDITISKYDSAGSKLLWATFLGGSRNEFPHSLVVDRNNDLIILGTTFSSNFPVDSLGYDTTLGGKADLIVSKLSEDGTNLLGSTYIGGLQNDGLNQSTNLRSMYADDFRGDIITDDDNNIFVATTSLSDDIPTVNAEQSVKSSAYDGYLFELSSDIHSLNWATFLGGNGNDAFYSIKLDQKGNIYIGGGTGSDDLPVSGSTISGSLNGDVDGLLAIIDKKSKRLKRLSYWGTPAYDQIYFIDRDPEGRIYGTGQTSGAITKTSGVYGESNKGQFIFRIDTLLQNQDFVTTFGNTIETPNLAPSAFLVDVCGHIYFSGWGSDVDPIDPTTIPGSTNGMVTSTDAVQKITDNEDFYIIVFGKDAKNLLYATFFGGDVTGDHVDGGTSRFDKRGVVYQSVCSSCPPSTDGQQTEVSDFPTTNGAVFETNPSVRCSNASFKIDLQIRSTVIADFVANPTVGCVPLDVQFTNKGILGTQYNWDFGDGSTSQDENPQHTFTDKGLYTVTLTVIDSSTCNISSVYLRNILVSAKGQAGFNLNFNGCENDLTIENTSTDAFEFIWDFGNGDQSTVRTPEYKYEELGDYKVTLTINESTLCQSEVSKEITISAKKQPNVQLYNVFTPNNDGVNDCFKFDGDFLECSDYLLKIYNRWGEKVFETDKPNYCWNGGLFNSNRWLPEGTYYYILQLGGEDSKPISGIVDLILSNK